MTFPDIWATVLLDREPTALRTTLASMGIDATPTQEGWLALPGGFLARIEPGTYPVDLVVHPGAEVLPQRSVGACLHVSGGALDEGPLLRTHTARRLLTGEAPSKSSRFRKVEALAEFLSGMAPLGEGLVLPHAAHRFVPWSSWPGSKGAGSVFGAFVTLAATRDLLLSRGMRIFGVPELGIGRSTGAHEAITRSMFDAAFEVAWQGFVPEGPATLRAFVDPAAGSFDVRPLGPAALFLGGTESEAIELAYRANVTAILGIPFLFDDRGAEGELDVAVYGGLSKRFLTTVGLHRQARADGRIELTATLPTLSRNAAFALHELSKLLLASGEGVQAYARVAIPPLERVGLAGVVLWPAGQVGLGREGLRAATWDALPVTPAELERFRAGEQEAWMDAVEAERAFPQLHARWSAG